MEQYNGLRVLTDVYEKICQFDEVEKAYRNARRGKRYRGDVLAFTANLESNLINICNHLQWETYEMGGYHPFYVREPKLRLVMSLKFVDRIVQWDVYDKLYPFFDRLMIDDSYACRRGKGSHKAADRLQYWLRQVDRKPDKWYYLKLDISKYFYRVDHAILEEILSRRIKDERLMRLLHKIINSEDTKFGLPAGMSPEDCSEELWLWDVGMPIGNLTSQLFANIYLNELDQFCKHTLHTHYYVRYMDDIIILSNSKRQLQCWKEEIEEFLFTNLHLDLNKKTAIRPITLGIDFVGYKIWATHRKLKKQTARRMIRHVGIMSEMLANGEMSREAFDRVVASYRGVLMHCNSYGLRQRLNEIYSKHNLPKQEDTPADSGNDVLQVYCGGGCYGCKHYFESYFCGYVSSNCRIHGSLDIDQHERHPDTAAKSCAEYTPVNGQKEV